VKCPGGLKDNPWFVEFGVILGVSSTGPMPATWADATYTAPPGSVIAGGSITGLIVGQQGPLNTVDAWISTPGNAPDTADQVANCEGPEPTWILPEPYSDCSWGEAGSMPPDQVAIPASGGSQLFMTTGCSIANTDPCPPAPGISASIGFDWLDILLQDPNLPTVSGAGVTGSLVAPGAVHGTASVSFTASDPLGPGIYNVTVSIDGTPIYSGMPSSNSGKCQPVGTDPNTGAMIFDYQQPCPTSDPIDLSVDTTKLSDGIHRLQITLEDAALNSATVLDQTFETENLTTAASTTTETPNTPTTTTPAPAPPAAPAAPAPAAASTPVVYAFKLNPATAKLVGQVLHRRFLGSKLQLSGTIVDPAGAPAPDVQVSAQVGTVSGTGFQTVASGSTDAAGRFKLRVPRGDSRSVQLVVSGHSLSFTQYVRPNVSLKVTAKRHQRLLFSGRVLIARQGGPPPVVELSDKTSAGWQALANVQADKHGRYRYTYIASSLAIGHAFQIQASTPASAFWQKATSKVISAKVI